MRSRRRLTAALPLPSLQPDPVRLAQARAILAGVSKGASPAAEELRRTRGELARLPPLRASPVTPSAPGPG